LAVRKKFFLGEKVNAELRVEFDNVLNRMRVVAAITWSTIPTMFLDSTPTTLISISELSHPELSARHTPKRGQAVLDETIEQPVESTYFLCGPTRFMELGRDLLEQMAVHFFSNCAGELWRAGRER
jgi:hypothetical protein